MSQAVGIGSRNVASGAGSPCASPGSPAARPELAWRPLRERVEASVRRDAVQPRSHLRRIGQAVARAPRAEQHVLHHFVDVADAPEHAVAMNAKRGAPRVGGLQERFVDRRAPGVRAVGRSATIHHAVSSELLSPVRPRGAPKLFANEKTCTRAIEFVSSRIRKTTPNVPRRKRSGRSGGTYLAALKSAGGVVRATLLLWSRQSAAT